MRDDIEPAIEATVRCPHCHLLHDFQLQLPKPAGSGAEASAVCNCGLRYSVAVKAPKNGGRKDA